MGFLCDFHDMSMIFLWGCYGIYMVLPWGFFGILMGFLCHPSWDFHKFAIVLL